MRHQKMPVQKRYQTTKARNKKSAGDRIQGQFDIRNRNVVQMFGMSMHNDYDVLAHATCRRLVYVLAQARLPIPVYAYTHAVICSSSTLEPMPASIPWTQHLRIAQHV